MSSSPSAEAPVPSDTVEPPATEAGDSAELPPAKKSLVAVLHDKIMRGPLFWSVIGRLPLYLVSVALVVFAASRGLSYTSVGLLLGGYSLGAAVLAPFVARCVDRYGQPPVLLITGVVYPLALTGFVYADPRSLPEQLACAVIGGAAIPPISGCIRSLWSAPGNTERVGLSIEAVLGEVFVIAGPLLFSLVLFWGSAGTALIVGGLLTGAGAIGFATTRASRARRVTVERRDPLGALRSAGLVRLLVVLLCAGLATGVYNVAVPAFVDSHGSARDIGLIFGVWGLGGILGGLWYGSRSLRRPTELLFVWGLLALSTSSALLLAAWDNWSLSAALVVLGLIGAPVTALSYELVSRTARPAYVTEAFTWAITVSVGGTAIGAQVGGLLLSASGTRAAFLGVVVIMLLASAIAFAARHRFTKPAETAGTTEGPEVAEATKPAAASS